MAETLTIDTTPETELVGELSADEQESLEIGEQIQAEESKLLAGKYKDAEELEKAYIELQGKLGEPKEESTEPEATTEPEEVEDESKEDEPIDSTFLDQLWEESQGDFKDDTLKQLSEMDPTKLAQMHLDYRANNQSPELDDKQVSQLKEVAGGDKQYDSMLNWAKSSLQKEEIDMYDKVMEQGNPLACFFAVQALKYRFDDASGTEGRMLTGKAPSTKGDQFKSQAQLVAAMNDPRYETDPAYRQDIMEKLENSDLNF